MLCILNVVGLTPKLLAHAPRLASLGTAQPWRSPLPAVTCTSQATMLTGLAPREHGVVGNGWYYRDTAEIRFWQQANSLIQGEKFYEGFRTAKMFWWFNQHAPVQWSATPQTLLRQRWFKSLWNLGPNWLPTGRETGSLPFHTFWGPKAGLPCSQWIAQASAEVIRQQKPEMTLVYLPHLDYEYQRKTEHDPERVAEVDRCAGHVIDAATEVGARVIAVSEYGLVPVSRPVSLNRHLRQAGWLAVRDGPFGEQLLPGDSGAFAVADHQVAHLYVRDPAMVNEVAALVRTIEGVDRVVHPAELELDHPRSGELIVLAKPDAWFTYYYWLDDQRAPDFARTVDIHRKPGYDPVELFMTSLPRAMLRLTQKKLGFRYRMDVIPLDPTLVRGSHGLYPHPSDGPLVIGPTPPSDMREFKNYVRGII